MPKVATFGDYKPPTYLLDDALSFLVVIAKRNVVDSRIHITIVAISQRSRNDLMPVSFGAGLQNGVRRNERREAFGIEETGKRADIADLSETKTERGCKKRCRWVQLICVINRIIAHIRFSPILMARQTGAIGPIR